LDSNDEIHLIHLIRKIQQKIENAFYQKRATYCEIRPIYGLSTVRCAEAGRNATKMDCCAKTCMRPVGWGGSGAQEPVKNISVQLKILRRSRIHIGLPLPMNIYDANGRLLLSHKKVLRTEAQLQILLSRGAYVDASMQGEDIDNVMFSQSLQSTAPVGLLQTWEEITGILQILLTDPQRKFDFPEQVEKVAERLVAIHDMNADFSIYRVLRQEGYRASSYGYTHAIHTAVLCILLSRHFDWPADRMMSLVKAALTMNMTIAKLQGTMSGQAGPMDATQRAEISSHPGKTLTLLKNLGVTDANWLSAVEQHHERIDGHGYPAGCEVVSEIATILRIADVFTAKISPRNFRAALSVKQGISHVFLNDKGGPVSMALIHTLGLYPPGELVRMASGELGIVVERTGSTKAPIVASITDTAGRPVPRLLRRDTRQIEFAIVGNVSNKLILQRLLPERLYGLSIVNSLNLPRFDLAIG
jgi:HD-GYP domain-containing protein (c-di-GMP phosphodiesterase class II)